jgi:hypothetical protein
MDLIRHFSADQFRGALESWDWIGTDGKNPLFTSPFGDVFFRAADGFWWLDTLEGSLSRPWTTAEELQSSLNTAAGQGQYLLAGLAASAEQQGTVPTADQVYGFTIAPVLGGKIDLGNIEVIDFTVSLHILGQLHKQVRALPPGTRISGITIDGKAP